jgi:hypothetical protein
MTARPLRRMIRPLCELFRPFVTGLRADIGTLEDIGSLIALAKETNSRRR